MTDNYNISIEYNQKAFDYIRQNGIVIRDCFEIRNFIQLWDSTALGFNRAGGDMMTFAMTTVILGKPENDKKNLHAYVFWHGMFAYEVLIKDRNNSIFMDDINHTHTADMNDYEEKYKND